MKLYKASVTPCRVESSYGVTFKRYEPKNGFETVLCGKDLSSEVINIVRSIECEVH